MEFSLLFPEHDNNFVKKFPLLAPKILSVAKDSKRTAYDFVEALGLKDGKL